MNNIEMTQQLLERLASLLRSNTRALLLEHGLQPIQFEVLQYLFRCNRYSNTPMAVAEFLGQTKGTVSQTLKVLETKGLLRKEADANDKRVSHLVLTSAGRALVIALLPSPLLTLATSLISDDELMVTNASLVSLLQALQEANNFKTFGQCRTCRHNHHDDSGSYRCLLTQEALSADDVQLICREHEVK